MKKKTVKHGHPVSTEEEYEGLEIVRHVGIFGQKAHSLLIRLPRALRIKKADAVAMHAKIDEDARLRSISYWVFIISSAGIAILGLLINSPAVIIGAMLVSPLMAPIMGLGMGIAVNDVYLSFKAVLGIALSVLLASATAAFISLIVPLNEPTAEILARTNPTVLDLFIALFCGLVASFSSVRSGGNSIMRDVAPGAAIGVALMPPLCVVGYGLGAGFKLSIMWGAFLLFLTNLMAIVLVSSIFFYFVYHSYRSQKLLELGAAKRRNTEPLYSSRWRLLWQETETLTGSTGGFRKRFWFPAGLILLISYPLITSFLFLKKKNDVRTEIEMLLETRISGLKLLRGPESLVYTRSGVRGNIIFSSTSSLPADFGEKLKQKIAKDHSKYVADISYVRMADDSVLRAMSQNKEASLDNNPGSLQDRVRHAYAADLVRRARDLLRRRFPEELGYLEDVKIRFGADGMDQVVLFYRGKALRPDTRRLLQSTFRNELRELKGDVRQLLLRRAGPTAGTFRCRRGPSGLIASKIKLQSLRVPLRHNPDLLLHLTIPSKYEKLLSQIFMPAELKRMRIDPQRRRAGCKIQYKFSKSGRLSDS